MVVRIPWREDGFDEVETEAAVLYDILVLGGVLSRMD